MSVSVNEFWNRLVTNGIADAQRCRGWAAEYAAEHQGQPPVDAPALARQLVKQARLTPFQAEHLLRPAAPHPLRYGAWLLREGVAEAPFRGWFWADSSGPEGATAMLFPFAPPAAELEIDRRWLRSQQSIEAAGLQPIEVSEETGVVVSRLPAGERLTERLQTGEPLERSWLPRIVAAVGGGLAGLHAAGLCHGAVSAERVWLGRDGSVWLLRDASGPPSGPFRSRAGWFAPLSIPGRYAAPEFSLPGQLPDPLTDQYALGGLLLHAYTGGPPFAGEADAALLRKQAEQTPAALRQAVAAGAAGDPLLRVLAHAMSKNAAARFPSIVDFHRAWEAAFAARPATPAPAPPAPQPPSRDLQPTAPPAQPALPNGPAAAQTPSQTAGGPPPAGRKEVGQRGGKSAVVPAPAAAEPAAGSTARQPVSPAPAKKGSAAPEKGSAVPEKVSAAPEKGSAAAEKGSAAPEKGSAAAGKTAAAAPVNVSSTPENVSSATENVSPATENVSPAPENVAAASAETAAADSPAAEALPSASAPAGASPPPETAAAGAAAPEGTPVVVDPEASPGAAQPSAGRTPRRGHRRKQQKQKQVRLVIGGLGFLVMVLLVVLLVSSGGERPVEEERRSRPPIAYQPPPRTSPSETPPSGPDEVQEGPYRLVNDRQALWVPSSTTAAAPLEMIPPGPQMVVRLRPQRLLSTPEGKRLLAAVEQELGDAWNALAARTGVPARAIEQLTVALERGEGGWPAAALAVTLAEPQTLGTLTDRWGATAARTPAGVTVFAGSERGDDAYYVAGSDFDDATPVRSFAVGTLEQIKLVAELEGGPIPLPRRLEQLWRAADGEADLIVMGFPNFLFADGRQMLAHYAAEIVGPLKQFLLPDVAGLLVSTTLQPQWYVEVQLAPGSGTSATQLAESLESAVRGWPKWAEDFLIHASPDASWKALAIRLPKMMAAVQRQTRVGVSDDHAVANLYLPTVAAPNVTLATLLAANTPPGGPTTTPTPTQPALTMEQMLTRPMTIRFDQESLERAARAILDEFGSALPSGSTAPEVVVIGGDLEKEGITQNQQIRDFDLSDKPLRDVLTELVMRANPVTTVQSPTETDQKLVWTVGPDPDDPARQAILITTRQAANDRYTLPNEFTED